jgi:diacylglycerol kinase (ATP)
VVRRYILIIVNPVAGRVRSAERRLGRFVAALERLGCAVVLRHAGPSLGDVERLAREAEPKFDTIVAAGGDGTVNAVVNGLAGRPIPIGVLPLGSANVLAREIGLPRNLEVLAMLIASGAATPIWPGRVGGRLFVMMASVGFDAEIVAAVAPRLKQSVGRLAFLWAFLVRLWRYRPSELMVRVNGGEHRAAGVIAAKGRHYAGPFIVAPSADLAEPRLELLVLSRGGRKAVLRYAIALFLGHLPRLGDVSILRSTRLTVTADRLLPVQADGEIIGGLPVGVAIAEQPVLLIRPVPRAQY